MTDALDAIITHKSVLAENIALLRIKSATDTPLAAFDAGAHIDIHLPNGMIRQYSLFNIGGDPEEYSIAVLREPQSRGGSEAIHNDLQEGDVVSISAPRNHFALADRETPALLVAGGIGITPILAMAETLCRKEFPFELHYCARSPGSAAFLEHLQSCPYASRVFLHFDDGPDDQRLDLSTVIGTLGTDIDIYVCGPAGFIDWAIACAQDAGVAPGNIHKEFFTVAKDADADRSEDTAFELVIASTGQTLTVPAGRSAASVLIEAGLPLAVSCEEGICGSCITRVLEGIPDHRDSVFTDAEHEANEEFTPCCSRAKTTRLVIDI